MASNLRKVTAASARTLHDVGALRSCEATHNRWWCCFSSSFPYTGHTARNMHDAPHASQRTAAAPAPQDVRRFSAAGEAPASPASLESMHGMHTVRMATAQQSVDELMGKITAESTTLSTEGCELACALRNFDGAAVLLQTGVLSNFERPVIQQVAHKVAPTLRSTAHTLTLQEGTNVLSTVALLNFYDVPLIAVVVQKLLPEIPNAPPATLAALCYSLGISGYSDHRLMQELEAVLQKRNAEFDIESFAKVVWMLGRAHDRSLNVATLVDTFAQRALSEHTTPQEVVYALWACGQHEAHLDELADKALEVVPGHMDEFTGGELAKLAYGLVEAECRDEEMFEEIASTGAKVVGTMWPRDIAKLMYSLGRVQAGDRKFAAVSGPHVIANLDQFTYNEMDMIVKAYNAWGIHDATTSAVAHRMAVH